MRFAHGSDFSPTGLRVLRQVAQSGSFTAAARALGYTQSAVSRQAAALEAVAGRALFERRRDGVVLTPAGARLLARAVRVLDELDAARRDTAEPDAPAGPVRLGTFATAAAGLLPAALASLPPALVVSVREATTPALARALRAGTLDLAVLAQTPPFRPPDAEAPALDLTTLAERELVIGVGARHRSRAGARSRSASSPARSGWPAARKPASRCSACGRASPSGPTCATSCATGGPSCSSSPRAWPSPRSLPWRSTSLPDGVRAVAVRGEPQELRRLVLARVPGPLDARTTAVADALVRAAGA